MRLEQLVLFGPSDNFCLRFGSRLTVVAGLEETERANMLKTMIDAMAGRLPNASVIFVDHAGRRVFADRSGATYADTGLPAPALAELLGTDPRVVADLVTLGPEDLGLGMARSVAELDADLAEARAVLERLSAEWDEAVAAAAELDDLRQVLHRLDHRIAHLPDEVAHWTWSQDRHRLDQLRGELAARDARETDGDASDARLLQAVDELRSAGEAWAEASAAGQELRSEIGQLPAVSDSELALVAATPEALPEGFAARVDDLVAALDQVDSSTQALLAATAEPEDPGDFVVYHLARIDQEKLWSAHAAVLEAEAIRAEAMAAQEQEVDGSAELAIEAAHREVVRCQREADELFRRGIFSSSALAVGALLVGQAVTAALGVVMLLAAIALCVRWIVIPRRTLAMAISAEEEALTGAEAGSWLGMHLRRIDHVLPGGEPRGLRHALDLSASSKLDWEALTGGTAIEAATERADAIRAHAAATDPEARAARERQARQELEAARAREATARRDLLDGLGAYGFAPEAASSLDATRVIETVRQRIAAGECARRVLELRHLEALATSTGALLDRLLRDLGFDGDGDLAGRLERAIVSVETARRRQQGSGAFASSREDLEREVAQLSSEVEQRQRLGWDEMETPEHPPPSRDQLNEQRDALRRELEARRAPDASDLERRVSVATARVQMLESERSTLAGGPVAVRRRLADRIGRTTWIGTQEETLPLLIDDAFVGVEASDLFEVLDMVVRLSARTQIILLTSDATIARWARREAATDGPVSLFEADAAPVR